MPMGDQTGPMGRGPRTGRAAGRCAGLENPGCANRGPGFGFGRGWGGGRGGQGWRRAQSGLPAADGLNMAAASVRGTAGADPERRQLRQQVGALQSELAAIQQRLRQLEITAENQPGAAGPASA